MKKTQKKHIKKHIDMNKHIKRYIKSYIQGHIIEKYSINIWKKDLQERIYKKKI